MWWLTLRLQRAELVLLLALAAAVTVPFLLTAGEGRLDERFRFGVATAETCPGDWVTYPTGDTGCQWAPAYSYQVMDTWAAGLVGLPIIVAIILAVPLVTQLQSRSYRVAWTQTPTRSRWALAHLAPILLVGTLITAAMILLMRWWPLTRWAGGWGLKDIDLRGIVGLGWYVLAAGLVLALATAIRRPLVALVVAAVAYGGIRVGWYYGVRPRLFPLREVDLPATTPLDVSNARMVDQWAMQSDGTRLSARDVEAICPFTRNYGGPGTTQEQAEAASRAAYEAYRTCLDSNGLMTHYGYQPASRFWPLQWAETGILVAVGLALVGWAAWYWLRRLE